MDNMENTVEMMLNESVQDDAAQAHPEGDSLEELTLNDDPAPAQEEAPPQKEPGWIKQRVSKAVDKAVATAVAEVEARYEKMLAPLRESMMDRQAQELVDSGEFKSLDRAKEYVRLKGGDLSAEPVHQPQPRDEQGRFQSQQPTGNDAQHRARADLLARQAQKISMKTGVDVMAAFNSDPDIKQKVISGEWDFYDVADHLASGQQRRMPSAIRNPNGALAHDQTIANMSDAQFEALQRNLAMGKRYNVSR